MTFEEWWEKFRETDEWYSTKRRIASFAFLSGFESGQQSTRAELKAVKAKLEFYNNRCPECGSVLGLLHKDACPLCRARMELEAVKDELEVWKKQHDKVCDEWHALLQDNKELKDERDRLQYEVKGLKTLHEEAEQENERLRGELAEWKIALNSLTPQGSEFANSHQSCVDYVREVIHSGHNAKKQVVILRRSAEKSAKALAELREKTEVEKCDHEFEPCYAVKCEHCGLIIED